MVVGDKVQYAEDISLGEGTIVKILQDDERYEDYPDCIYRVKWNQGNPEWDDYSSDQLILAKLTPMI